MPQRYQTERRFVGTFLKLLFFNHALARFDAPKAVRDAANLLVLVVDECQHFVTTSEHGMSDHNVIDVVREARLAVIAATQSTTSLVPVLGIDQARVYTLNLRNRLIFTAADELDSKSSAEFLGKTKQRERSVSVQGGRVSETLRERDEFRVKPQDLTALRKHQCILAIRKMASGRWSCLPVKRTGRFRSGIAGAGFAADAATKFLSKIGDGVLRKSDPGRSQ